MDTDLAQKAIFSALSGDWEEAKESNLAILKLNPNDVDALNRLARAYFELGNITKAKEEAQKVLKIDCFNSIAQKALEKWKGLKKAEIKSSPYSKPQNFIEEPGKTKTVGLLYLGDSKLLAKLDAGDLVNLNTHCHRISITSIDSKYIGRLPDDLSSRIKKYSGLGYHYTAAIKCINKNQVKIFIRECGRPNKYKDVPSFPAEKIDYISYTPPELIHSKQDEEAKEEVSEIEEIEI
jgi:tetratricopeptide (TPR) repeat protein